MDERGAEALKQQIYSLYIEPIPEEKRGLIISKVAERIMDLPASEFDSTEFTEVIQFSFEDTALRTRLEEVINNPEAKILDEWISERNIVVYQKILQALSNEENTSQVVTFVLGGLTMAVESLDRLEHPEEEN